MKQMRPFTLNDLSAVFSWIFVGHTVWLVVGTTSFISLFLWTANSLQFQEWIVQKTGHFLSLSTGSLLSFQSITPNWKDGKIRFDRLRISCMPRSEQAKFESGSYEVNPTPVLGDLLAGIDLDQDERKNPKLKRMPWFDLTADTVEFELSMLRWMAGKGLIKTAHVKGVRGVIDNRRGDWNQHLPVSLQREPSQLEIERLLIDDASVTVYMPAGFRPFPISILQAQFTQFRKQWLLLDILCADYLIGAIDTSVLSIHPAQIEKSVLDDSGLDTAQRTPGLSAYYPYNKLNPEGVFVSDLATAKERVPPAYQRKSRISVLNLSLDHAHRLGEGPPQWITAGTLDFCADVYAPDRSLEPSRPGLWAATLDMCRSVLPTSLILGWGNGGHLVTLGEPVKAYKDPLADQKLRIDIDLRFKDIKGAVPHKIPQFNHLKNAMIRPVLAYINRNRTLLPIKGCIVIPLQNMNGAYTLQEATLTHHLNRCITQACVDLATNHQERNRHLKKIGFWSFHELIRYLVTLHHFLKSGTTARHFWAYLGQ
ncbi:mitochondrial distribution and morphology protein family 31/32 [Sporodiniella umbellata]|nr:mitochondrial distribution and morphology protein family 31/32 [Sporodiniella umbellata]